MSFACEDDKDDEDELDAVEEAEEEDEDDPPCDEQPAMQAIARTATSTATKYFLAMSFPSRLLSTEDFISESLPDCELENVVSRND